MMKDTDEVVYIGEFDSSKYTKNRRESLPERGQMFVNGNEVFKARIPFRGTKLYTIVEEKKREKTLFYKGQEVQSDSFGYGWVVKIDDPDEHNYPVIVRFNNDSEASFTLKGHYYGDNSEPLRNIRPVDNPCKGIGPGTKTLYANTYDSRRDAEYSTSGRELETAVPMHTIRF